MTPPSDPTPNSPEGASVTPLREATVGTPASSDAQPEEEGGARGRRIVILLLAVALLVCGILLALETRQTAALTEQVAGLEADLVEARAEISAHQRHLFRVRSQVGALARELGLLETLVEQDPTAETGASEGP